MFKNLSINVIHFKQFNCKYETTPHRKDSKPAANMGFAIAGIQCFVDIFVQGESSVLRMKFSAKTPRHRRPPKRYAKLFVDLQTLN